MPWRPPVGAFEFIVELGGGRIDAVGWHRHVKTGRGQVGRIEFQGAGRVFEPAAIGRQADMRHREGNLRVVGIDGVGTGCPLAATGLASAFGAGWADADVTRAIVTANAERSDVFILGLQCPNSSNNPRQQI